jgi:hypothetical protein
MNNLPIGENSANLVTLAEKKELEVTKQQLCNSGRVTGLGEFALIG